MLLKCYYRWFKTAYHAQGKPSMTQEKPTIIWYKKLCYESRTRKVISPNSHCALGKK